MLRTCPMCGGITDVASEQEAFICPSCGTEVGNSTPDFDLREKALRKLRPPAVGLITLGILALLLGLLALLAVLGELVFPQMRQGTEVVAHVASLEYVLRFSYAILLPVLGSLMVAGGRCMRKLRNRRLALAGSIAAILPTPFIAFALPFGIWSLIVLTRPSVKAAFTKN